MLNGASRNTFLPASPPDVAAAALADDGEDDDDALPHPDARTAVAARAHAASIAGLARRRPVAPVRVGAAPINERLRDVCFFIALLSLNDPDQKLRVGPQRPGSARRS
jgi:hypothetical protein